MSRRQTILYATDLSPASTLPFELACSLSRATAGRLVVLHVAEPPVVLYDEAGNLLPGPQDYRQTARDGLLRLRANAPDLPMDLRLAEGEVSEAVGRTITDLKPDLLILGTHDHRGLDRLIIGSVAGDLMRNATCPVAVVHARQPHVGEQNKEGQAEARRGLAAPVCNCMPVVP